MDQLVLAGEIGINGASGQAGRSDNVIHGRRLQSLLLETGQSGIQNLLLAGGAFFI